MNENSVIKAVEQKIREVTARANSELSAWATAFCASLTDAGVSDEIIDAALKAATDTHPTMFTIRVVTDEDETDEAVQS